MANGERMRTLLAEMIEKREKNLLMGGDEQVARQRQMGKMTVRERIDELFDADTFIELGVQAQHSGVPGLRGKSAPCDGVVTGYGDINGRSVVVAAYDFTVLAGSMGRNGEMKVTRIREMALARRVPIIWLIDSSGARVQEAAGSQFAGSGFLFREQACLSGVVPQVAAMMGPGVAGTAYIPALADVVFMVEGSSSMALAGPHLVKAAVGEEIGEQELGGSKVHCEVSGCAHKSFKDDHGCLAGVKEYLSYMPTNCEQLTPMAPCDDPVDRRDDELLDIIPDDSRKSFDMKEVITRIVDDGHIFELQPDFGKAIITCFGRMGGRSVGVVASQGLHVGGAIDNDAADKAARFITLCDAYNIPLLFLQDVPGFWVGSRVEKQGIIRHGAKMLYAVSNASVPKVTVIIRKAYGAGYFVMCGRAYEPDLIVAWPTAEISLMGPEGAVNILFRKAIAKAPDPDKARNDLVEQFRAAINPYIAAQNALIDDLIDPRDTRSLIIKTLKSVEGKKVLRARRKTGIWPV
jgi:acetyl-CoA carboxylase carboxyltransferase component